MNRFIEVDNYEGYYEVSTLGQVRSIDRIIKRSNGRNQTIKGCWTPMFMGEDGYFRVALHKDGKTKNFLVHQLIAIAFLKHKPNGHKIVVDHIDGNKENNTLKNLQLISNRENCSKDKNTKYTGVRRGSKNKWRADIRIKGKKVFLGSFNTPEEANKAYQLKLKEVQNEY